MLKSAKFPGNTEAEAIVPARQPEHDALTGLAERADDRDAAGALEERNIRPGVPPDSSKMALRHAGPCHILEESTGLSDWPNARKPGRHRHPATNPCFSLFLPSFSLSRRSQPIGECQ